MPTLNNQTGNLEISIYEDREPNEDELLSSIGRLKIAFPKMQDAFFALLIEFILKEKFTKKRLNDAVNELISTFQYKEINISDIIKFDKKKQLYTYNEVCSMQEKGVAKFDDFEHYRANNKLYWIKKN